MRFFIMLLSSLLVLQRRLSMLSSNQRYVWRTAARVSHPSFSRSITTRLFSTSTKLSEEQLKQFENLRGTPELVDRLEYICGKNPGIELDMNLYRTLYPFPLDDFQVEGLSSLMSGRNVIVMTPTGSGKTLVGELAIYFALMMGLRVAYTTPLKALSNQKFQDFKAKFGADRVGLMTGDIAINRGAQITVMTTEVFRNIIYDPSSSNQLANLFMVCFDEFHFMNDPDRGTVWEESVISCPGNVRILALSATMGNVEEIQGWMAAIHGPTDLIQSTFRPVPLRYFYGMKNGLHPFFRDPQAGPGAPGGVKKDSTGSAINPSILRLEALYEKNKQTSSRSFKGQRQGTNPGIPKYSELVEELHSLEKLPAIVFIFSRNGCEDAARMIQNIRTNLLTVAEQNEVSVRVAQFLKDNPEIPLAKSSVYCLQRGIGVHHAGLISVWKAFIEELFNANLVKVLFATETLAAGVNMPARSTVITSVTKRINGETIRLKPSQLLQMAGRAGRRGKDVEGNVVFLKNKFDDISLSHQILVSKVDSIKSHFKTSYSLAVKLLTTKTMDECKALMERGFGAYQLQKKMIKREKKGDLVTKYRQIIEKYSLSTIKQYQKLLNKLQQQQRSLSYLLSQFEEKEKDMVQAVVDYMPMGTGLELRDGGLAYFLGDAKMIDNKAYSSASNQRLEREMSSGESESSDEENDFYLSQLESNGNKFKQAIQKITRKNKPKAMRGYGVITQKGKILIVQKEHIRKFANDPDDSMLPRAAQKLLDLIHLTPQWDPVYMSSISNPLYESVINPYSLETLVDDEDIHILYREVVSTPRSFSPEPVPYSVEKQRIIVNNLQKEVDAHPLCDTDDGELALNALDYLSTLKDPSGFMQGVEKGPGEIFAWKMFLSVVGMLEHFDAVQNHTATPLGHMISSFSGDNELWLSLLLSQTEVLEPLSYAEFGAMMAALNVEQYKVDNSFFKVPTSPAVQDAVEAVMPISMRLRTMQVESNIDFPILLSPEICGIAEMWCKGSTWKELCASTSMDQGDLCRIFRRTVEILRQIPQAYHVDYSLVEKAEKAALMMDRYPVADQVLVEVPVTGTTLEKADTEGSVGEEEEIIDMLDAIIDRAEEEEEEKDEIDLLLEEAARQEQLEVAEQRTVIKKTMGKGFSLIGTIAKEDISIKSTKKVVKGKSNSKQRGVDELLDDLEEELELEEMEQQSAEEEKKKRGGGKIARMEKEMTIMSKKFNT